MITGKIFAVLFSVFSLIIAFVTMIHLVIFLSNFNEKPYKNAGNATYVDDDVISTATWSSIIDISLLILFIVQHSLLASPLNKLMTYLQRQYMYRTFYNMLSCLVLQTLLTYWRPIPDYQLWNVSTEENSIPLLTPVFVVIHVLAWLVFYIMTLSFDIPELLGIKQLYYHYFNPSSDYYNYSSQGKSESFSELLNKMKHPGFVCLIAILWIYPVMRLDRVIIAVTWTIYMALAWDLDDNDYNYIIEQRQKKFVS